MIYLQRLKNLQRSLPCCTVSATGDFSNNREELLEYVSSATEEVTLNSKPILFFQNMTKFLQNQNIT